MPDLRKEWTELSQYRSAYALAASASLGSIFYGWDVGLIGGILSMASFQQYFGLDKATQETKDNLSGNIVSVLQAGCFFGALSTGYFAAKFGRRPSMIAASLVYIVGSLIQTVSGIQMSHSTGLSVLYFSRFLGGWGVGMVSALVPTYVSECAPKAIRGRCTGMVQFANNVGIMLSYWVNYSVSKNMAPTEAQWRLPFGIQILPGVFFLIAMVYQPESPRWLTEQGRLEQAEMALLRINSTNSDSTVVLVTIAEMKQDFEGRAELSIWQQLRFMFANGSMTYRAIIPLIVTFFQQWTGTNAINYYSPSIFKSLSVAGQNAGLFATGIYGIVKVISVGATLAFAVESFGRKKCLMLGGLIQGVTMFWIGGYLSLSKQSGHVGGAGYVSIVCVYLYAVGFCVGWGPVPWVVASEVTPNNVRSTTMALAIGVNWLFSFIISRFTPNMLSTMSYGTFLLFGCMCVIMVIWTYVALPETSGIALEHIHVLFEDHVIVRSLLDAPGGRIFLGRKQDNSLRGAEFSVPSSQSEKVASCLDREDTYNDAPREVGVVE